MNAQQSEPNGAIKPGRRLVAFANALEQCDTVEQMFDADNDYYLRVNVLNRTITITSARQRQSDYADTYYAQIGFTAEDGSDGQFNIGGNGARLPLILQRFNRLPVTMTLRTVPTQHGPIWKWERT